MNPITTATRDINAFKTLTLNRDHNKGGLVLGEGGGLTCVNHHWINHLANNHTITPEENNGIRQAFADALLAEYGARLSALAAVQGGTGRCARILQRINRQQFGSEDVAGLSRATVKATIEEVEAVLARASNNVNTMPRQIQLRMAGVPLQDLLDEDLGLLLEPEAYQDLNAAVVGDVDEHLLQGAGAMVSELLKTDAVQGALDDKDKVSNPPARKAAIEGNCKFFATILLKFLQGFPDLREELKTSDASDAKWNFCKFVRNLDRKLCSGVWTKRFIDNSDSGIGSYSMALVEIAKTVFKHKLDELNNKVNKLEADEQPKKREAVRSYIRFLSGNQAKNGGAMFGDLTFEEVFAKGDTGEFVKYDVNRLKEFFDLCEAFDVDVNVRVMSKRREV